MLQLRHTVPEVVGAKRVGVVVLSDDRVDGDDMAERVRFWSPSADVDVVSAESSDGVARDLVIVVHPGLLYRRGGRLRRTVESHLASARVVATVDLGTQRIWRIERGCFRGFARRALVYPYLLAIVRRLPSILRRPLVGAR